MATSVGDEQLYQITWHVVEIRIGYQHLFSGGGVELGTRQNKVNTIDKENPSNFKNISQAQSNT